MKSKLNNLFEGDCVDCDKEYDGDIWIYKGGCHFCWECFFVNKNELGVINCVNCGKDALRRANNEMIN